jgi:transcriptional regulator with XRE-family HTH domain
MRLASAATLRALMAQKGVSLADMARAAGTSKGFISHLTAERRNTCSPPVAERIARRLDVPLTVLFVPSTSITSGGNTQQRRKVVA